MTRRLGLWVAALVVAVTAVTVAPPPVGAEPPSSKTVVLDQYPVSGECHADAVPILGLGTLYVVTGSWRPYDSPLQGQVTCLVNGRASTAPVWIPAGLSPLAPAFPFVPFGLAAGTALVTGDQLRLCVRVEWSETYGNSSAQACA